MEAWGPVGGQGLAVGAKGIMWRSEFCSETVLRVRKPPAGVRQGTAWSDTCLGRVPPTGGGGTAARRARIDGSSEPG